MGLGGLGMWEIVLIFLVILLLFGAKRLPEIGSSLGKGIREFKGSIREIEKEVKASVDEEPSRDAVPPPSASSDEADEGPRRLVTDPAPGSSDWSAAVEESAEEPVAEEAEEEAPTE